MKNTYILINTKVLTSAQSHSSWFISIQPHLAGKGIYHCLVKLSLLIIMSFPRVTLYLAAEINFSLYIDLSLLAISCDNYLYLFLTYHHLFLHPKSYSENIWRRILQFKNYFSPHARTEGQQNWKKCVSRIFFPRTIGGVHSWTQSPRYSYYLLDIFRYLLVCCQPNNNTLHRATMSHGN